jgi:hypothetical protein
VDLKFLGEVYRCNWLPFFSLKGWNKLAQGNALGRHLFFLFSPKGWNSIVPALQAGKNDLPASQGFALGYVVPAFQAEDADRSPDIASPQLDPW